MSTSIKRYHFVYRITNIKDKMYYYGTHTTAKTRERLPEDELGITYFSSSTDESFQKDQKENPQNYKYKVLKVFPTRKEALEMEIMLHNKFNVGINESFYNKCKQTSSGFDATGFIHNTPFWQGKKHKVESINKMKQWTPTPETRAKMSENHADINGDKNPASAKIGIYDNHSNLVIECFGNFKKICKENNYPTSMFIICLYKGKSAYETPQAKTRAKKYKNEKYIGWTVRHL